MNSTQDSGLGLPAEYTLKEGEYDFDEMFMRSPILAAVNPIKMNRSRVEVPIRDFESVEGELPSTYSHITLTSTQVHLPFEVASTLDQMEDKEAEAEVKREMYLNNATELEDLLINGDVNSTDSLLRVGNGILAFIRGKGKEITLGYDSLAGFAEFIKDDKYTLLHNHSFEIEHTYQKAIMVDTLDQNTAVFINLDNVYAGYEPTPKIRRVQGGPGVPTEQYFAVHHRVALKVANPEDSIIVNLFQKD